MNLYYAHASDVANRQLSYAEGAQMLSPGCTQ